LAGGVASLVQAFPEVKNTELLDYVRQSASQYSNPDFFIGYGIPDFQFALTLGFDAQFTNLTEFDIFPNPAHSNLFVKFSELIGNVKLTIHNVLGQLMYENQVERMKPIHIEAFSKGLYLVTIHRENHKSITFKLIKE
jgi:hypothetical protein